MEITPKYKHTKVGLFLFNLCATGTKFLVKHRVLYYILACTYGFIMTVGGLVVSCILYLVKLFVKDKNKIIFKLYNLVYSISIGSDLRGGCDFGLCFF